MTGTGALLRFLARRDRILWPAWVGGLGLLSIYFMTAIAQVAETQEELDAIALMLQDPTLRILTGPGYGLDALTHERFFAAEYLLYVVLGVALMSIFMMSRHTRVEEQTGRAELIRANVVGRHASLTAALIHVGVAQLVLGLVVTASAIVVADFAVTGSVLAGTAVTLTGWLFAAIMSVTVQLTEGSRTASALAGALLAVFFLLRAAGDAAELGGSALSWWSPLGWVQQTAPYVLDRFWPLGLSLGLALVLVVAGYLLSTRRDVGASLFPPRRGRSRAPVWMGTDLGLAYRLLRGTLRGWGVAMVLWGLMMVSFVDSFRESQDNLPEIFAQMFPVDQLIDAYLGMSVVTVGLVAAAAVVSGMTVLRGEEQSGRAELVLALPMSRVRWLLSNLAVLYVGVVAVLAVTGVLSGVVVAAQMGDSAWVATLTGATVQHAVTVAAVLGVVTLLFGWLPRLAVGVGWLMVGYGFLAEFLGELLDLPDVLLNASVFGVLGYLPLEEFDPVAWWSVAGGAVLVTVLGLVGWRRRDTQSR